MLRGEKKKDSELTLEPRYSTLSANTSVPCLSFTSLSHALNTHRRAHTSCCDHDAQRQAPSGDRIVSCVSIGTHTLEKGVVTMGMVRKIIPQKGLILNLPFGNSGLACITDLSDAYIDAPFEQYKEGQLVRYENPYLWIETLSLISIYHSMKWDNTVNKVRQ